MSDNAGDEAARATVLLGEVLLEAAARAGYDDLGRSRAGRPLWGRVFAPLPSDSAARGARPPRRLLVVGGVHGDEPSSVAAALELGARLAAAPPATTVTLLPALNPDGVAAGRKNGATDVDLNRNFPARNFTREHRAGYDPGPYPLSEPETALLARLVDAHAIDAVVAVHAPFACVNFDGPAGPWAQAVAAACGWPARADIGYPTPGSLGSWLGHDCGCPILTLELPAGPFEAFRAQAAAALDAAVAFSG